MERASKREAHRDNLSDFERTFLVRGKFSKGEINLQVMEV